MKKKGIITPKSIDIFELGKHISLYKGYLRDAEFDLQSRFFIEYRLNKIILVFSVLTGKLAKMSVVQGYDGVLFSSISIGQPIIEVIRKYKLHYNDDENYYMIDGYDTIGLDLQNPYQLIEENPQNKINEITIFDKFSLYF